MRGCTTGSSSGDREPEEELAEELEEGALDPDEVDPLLDPWDPGSDDEV